ncbi:hypothetical protein K439DRAFT_1625671 [Ramaria rubella]|nr:hypothetical protein K439DRAFT_1625671 [Ramaria rubella]
MRRRIFHHFFALKWEAAPPHWADFLTTVKKLGALEDAVKPSGASAQAPSYGETRGDSAISQTCTSERTICSRSEPMVEIPNGFDLNTHDAEVSDKTVITRTLCPKIIDITSRSNIGAECAHTKYGVMKRNHIPNTKFMATHQIVLISVAVFIVIRGLMRSI